MSVLTKVFGDPIRKELGRHRRIVAQINALSDAMKKLSDAELRAKTDDFRKRLSVTGAEVSHGQAYAGGIEDSDAAVAAARKAAWAERRRQQAALDGVLPEAFAVVREMSDRVLGMRHYDVQLIGAMVLHEGKIAEMRTGEGKTLVATAALYLNALLGKGAHLVTVNDYLARRDAGWNAPLYHALGMTVGIIAGQDQQYVYDPEFIDEAHDDERLRHLRPCPRREAYSVDITYATNNELGFDYLRDNMASSIEACVQRRLHYAIVDEVDSILVDEARTPLIISGQGNEPTDKYYHYARMIPRLVAEDDYAIDEKSKSASLTDDGVAKIEQWTGIGNIFDMEHVADAHQLNKALLAHALYQKDRDYIVKDGEVIIVDEFTGRTMAGRRWSDGLHQAIEAKEGVKVQQENITMATITFQNFFRLYAKLSGMTGTALTEQEEFDKIYHLDVVPIPTHRPMVRADQADVIFRSEEIKFNAVVDEIEERAKIGQPVLVGTTSIEKSERLSRLLEKRGITHNVLNAKQHEREATIVSEAGKKGAVTIATNMAGRGTDIVLGEGVKDLGGLYIIGTERHESRRIDNQLRGRAGRQGDPGETRFILSFEDDVMRVFGGDRVQGIMARLRIDEDEAIESRIVSRQIESAQSRVEGHNFDARRHVVQYDDVMNRQREIIYGERRKILEGTDTKTNLLRMIETVVAREVPLFCTGRSPDAWDLEGLWERLRQLAPLAHVDEVELDSVGESIQQIVETLVGELIAVYEEREELYGSDLLRSAEQNLMLRIIDERWVAYLTQMDHLRDNIGMQSYGQKDPLIEFKTAAFESFQELVEAIEEDVVRLLCTVQIQRVDPDAQPAGADGAPQVSAAATAAGDVTAPASPRADRPGTAATADPLAAPPAARPAAAAASAALARATRGASPFASVTNVVESSGAGTRSANLDPAHGGGEKVRKVGRNEACPCGSGDKYKFCHGK